MKLKLFILRKAQKQHLKRSHLYYINGIQIIPGLKKVTLTEIS